MKSRQSLAACLFVCLAAAASPQPAAADPQYVTLPNQYIVTFRDDISRQEVMRLTRELTAENRLRLRHMFRDSIKGFSAVIPESAVEVLRNHPAVAAIEQNGYWYLEGGSPRIQTVDAPTNVAATPFGDAQIDLTWTDNATTDVGTQVMRSTTGPTGSYTELAQLIGANVTSYSDTDVVTAQEYCYQIRVAESLIEVGPFSDPVCATIEDIPPVNPPAAPTGLTTTTINDQRIDLAWIDLSNDESGFRIERATGSGGTFAEIDLAGANATVYQDTGLSADTEFCYRVRAFNSAGNSTSTAEVCATTDTAGPPTGPLGAPSDLTASPLGDTQMTLAWTDNATNELGFEVQRSDSGINGPYVGFTTPAPIDATSYADIGPLVAGIEYCYQVRAGRSLGELGEFSNRACAIAGPPPPGDPPSAPSALSSVAISFQRIDLAWTDNADDESGFEIERAIGLGGTFVQIDVVGIDVGAYQDGSLSASTEYCYRVRAFNSAGDSPYTATSCTTTPEAPPPGSCVDTGNHDDLAGLWGITRVKADLNSSWQATQTAGCEMTPWFFGLDSGVDSDHPDLNVEEIMGFIAADPTANGEDGNGHGTHTAGTATAIDGGGGVVGVAPGTGIYGFKVCDDNGSCAIDDIIAGVDEVTARKLANPGQPMVANMSLGGGINVASDTAVRRSINAGVVYTLSAGNGALGACIFPANSENSSPARTGDDQINAADGSDGDTAQINGAITVTSSNQADADADCNFGDPVTVAAPGVDILSTWLAGGYNTISGTSMAAPHAAGAAILYLHRNAAATPAEVEQAIVNELDPWSTNDTPNAAGRLDVETL